MQCECGNESDLTCWACSTVVCEDCSISSGEYYCNRCVEKYDLKTEITIEEALDVMSDFDNVYILQEDDEPF